jgi:putative phage-type endonuclease
MTTDIIPFTTEDAWLAARKLDVTSTESAALFGMSPYTTHFELWHAKRSGLAREFKVNERMQWGNRLEAAIAHGIAEEQGWEIKPLKEYMRDPDARLGSSFDFVITSLGEPVHLEIKNVDYLAFRDGWIEHDDGSIEAPEHIEMQVQHQMAVSGFKRAYIGAFIAGNRGVVIERERDEAVIAAIRHKVAAFWRTVDAGDEPAAIMPGDAEAVIRLNQYAQPGKILDVGTDANITALVSEYKRAAAAESTAAEDKEVAKAELLKAIGDAEKVLLDGWTISASLQAETPATVITADMIGKTYGGRKGFRNLRINARKPK